MNLKNFVNIGGELKTNHRIYSYVNDAEYISMDDMLADGFFNEAFGQLKVDDKILVYDSTSYETVTVISIDNGVIKTKKLDANSGGGSSTDNNGLEGDYCSKYGIVDETTSGLPSIGTGNQVIIPAGLVMDVPGVSGLTTNATVITHDLTSTTNCELFYAGGEIIEATDVFFQTDEPQNGATGFAAWWNGTEWKFKSNDTGNVWSVANAVRIAKCIFTDGNLTRLCFTGCRLLNKQEFISKKTINNVNEIVLVGHNIFSIYKYINGNYCSLHPTSDGGVQFYSWNSYGNSRGDVILEKGIVKAAGLKGDYNANSIGIPSDSPAGGKMLVAVPPTAEGTYVLKATVSADGTVTTTWAKES